MTSSADDRDKPRPEDVDPFGLNEVQPGPNIFSNRPPGWLARRREKVVAEIERNRRGEFKVPTWVLTTLLVVIVLAFAALLLWG
jgi:hypothetical protein